MRIAVPAEVPTLIKSVTVAFEEELIRLANLGRAEWTDETHQEEWP